MFEEVPILFSFLIITLLLSYMLVTYTPQPLDKIIVAISIVSIVLHELCHYVMCLITNVRIDEIKFVAKSKDENGHVRYGGWVAPDSEKRLTFLQALLIGIAPLVLSFWLFFYLWDLLFIASIDLLLKVIYLCIMISIILYSAPSFADLACIPKAFSDDSRYSFYQIIVLTLSILVVLAFGALSFSHEIFTYLTIFILYYCFKYGF